MPGTVFTFGRVDRDMGRHMQGQRSMAEQQNQQQCNLASTIMWHLFHGSAISLCDQRGREQVPDIRVIVAPAAPANGILRCHHKPINIFSKSGQLRAHRIRSLALLKQADYRAVHDELFAGITVLKDKSMFGKNLIAPRKSTAKYDKTNAKD